ncbi:unnamed protein product [Anisakis simplex]|uniref:Secreted protein n=1 Tax=Anisakis simplex TaxID=6269 RepID=A0A0M3KE48_ANISI|nr:unnamed protein product [Anisakis simplex]VDK65661.1 unnamed protein product [Anisakis simplex]
MRSFCVLLVVGSLLVAVCFCRPPTPEEVKEHELIDYFNDYDTLPNISLIPDSWKESVKKERMRYLQMLQQQAFK